jgi:hypothetical protein
MKRIVLLFMSGALMLSAAGKGVYTGVITDTMCGANHKPMNVSPDAKCVLECVQHDKQNKYALFDGKNLYTLSDQQTPAKFAAQKVKITGTLYEKTKILQVDSIESAAGSMEMPEQPSGHSGHSGHPGR